MTFSDRSHDASLPERYAVERELGRGGMATVYLARDLKYDRAVAVKIIRPELSSSLAADRFLREIRTTAQLQHPHILALYDSGDADGLLYYVMPYVQGSSLRARLLQGGELPLDDTVRILHEIVDALAYAHARGIVHRDVKPENILLAGAGTTVTSRSHAVVADFGIAKAIGGAASTPLTTTGLVLGTPAYMAPEQAAGDPGVDHRADIYAVGVLGYELLTGAPPFGRGSAAQMMAAQLTRMPDLLSNLRPNVPAALEQLVMRCLQKRPADRWQTADELLMRLDALRGDLNVSDSHPVARRNETAERTFRLSERVCRRLDRATLDPRILGDDLRYADNQVGSDVLVCYLHGCGLDHHDFAEVLETSPYRGVAPTLYGFERNARRRIALSLENHLAIVREFLREMIGRTKPRVTVLVGFSSGADFAFRLLGEAPADETPLAVDGLLSLGCNLSVDTCFASRLIARLPPEEATRLEDLRRAGLGARSLDEWLDIHEYFVRVIRKFREHTAPLQHFGVDIVRPFETTGERAFEDSFREASAHVRCVRCVFEDADPYATLVQSLRLRNFDEGVLGNRYREDTFVTEPGSGHFDLQRPAVIGRHLDAVVKALV